MHWRKFVSLEHVVSALCAKGKVISGFGLGVLASLLVFALLFSAGGNNGGAGAAVDLAPSLLSRFFSAPGNGSGTTEPGSWLTKGGGGAGGEAEEMDGGKSSISGGEGRVWEISEDGSLSGGEGDGSGRAGVQGRSVGNGTGPGSYAEWIHAGKSPENGTVESGVLKQGGRWESSGDANSTGLGNGSGSLKSEAAEKSHGKNSSADQTSSAGGGELLPGSTGMGNLSLQESYHSLSVASRVEDKTNKMDLTDVGAGKVEEKANQTVSLDAVGNGTGGGGEAKEPHEAADSFRGPSPGRMNSWLPGRCDIFDGRWVRDENKPYYPPGSCPHIDVDFNCHDNGRPDSEFLRWRWQPNDCDIPSLNATDFLTRLRGQRLIFVGDSLNRNMWESLVCILRHGARNKSRVYEMSGRNQFKTNGYYSFIFEDYNCSVDFVRSPFLVRELYTSSGNGSEDEKLRLDAMDATTSAYHEADIIVFNTGHWWTHEKTSRGINYYQEGGHVFPVLNVMEAYKKALSTWAKWVDENINPSTTQVFFRGFSLTHFSGGQWNSGGQCHKETEPIFNQSFLRNYPEKMTTLEEVLKRMKTPVIYLNISLLTDYRKDGHPSIYRKKYESVEKQINAEKLQDCSHWCLPGIPDAWNELLYASLLMVSRGSWTN